MSTFKKFATLLVGASLVAALAVAVTPSSAGAQTVDELKAQIAALTALVQQLQANFGGGTPSATFTRDLTVGSTGADVQALQRWLNANGYQIAASGAGSPGNESTTFGQLTKAALARYQAAVGISPAAGYFGPITRARLSPVAGTPTPTPGTPSPTPSGDEGTLEDFDQLSKYSAEEVGEGEDDVKVLGIEFAAEDADQTIERVEVVIDAPTDGDDLEDFIQDVSIWLDGKELARKDVDEASHDRDEDEYTFRFTGLNGLVDEGDMAQLIVAVTGVNNIDSGDATEGWTVAIPADGIRAVSPNGVSDEFEDLFDETFTLETFASATGLELKITTDDSSPDARVVDADDEDDTDNVTLLVGTLEADGSDITLFELPITLTATGATDVDAVANRLILNIGGDEFTETITTTAAAATVVFDDLEVELNDGDKVKFTVSADVNDLEAVLFDEADTLLAELTATNRDFIDAEDDSGEDLEDSDKTGTALGDEVAFYDTGIYVTLSDTDQTVQVDDGSDDDTGTFIIKFKVTAFDGTIFVSDSAAATIAATIPDTTIATDGIRFLVDKGGTATVADLSDATAFTTSGGAEDSVNGIELEDGESTTITLTVTRTNNGDSTDNGLFRTLLKAVGWNTDDSTTFNVYDFDLEDYKTDNVSLD